MVDSEPVQGLHAFLQRQTEFEDYQHLLPDDIRQSVNEKAGQRPFRSEGEMHRFVEELARRV